MAEAESIKVKVTAEVDASGAKDAAKQLDDVAKSAKNAQKAFKNLNKDGASSFWSKAKSIKLGYPDDDPKGHYQPSKEQGKIAEQTKRIGEASKKATPWVEKFTKNIGRIILYRAIRAAMSAITQSLQEGLKNFRLWSNYTGGTFSEAVYKANAKFIEMKNAIAVGLAPIIENVLLPAFTKIADAIINAGNAASKFFAMLKGADDYAATTAISVEDSARSLGDLKKQLLGFDELNVLSSNGDGSSTGNATNMFQRLPIEDDWYESFKAALENNDFSEAGRIIGDKLNETLQNIDFDWEGVGKKLKDMIKNAIDFVNGVLSKVDFYELTKKIVNIIQSLFDEEDVAKDGLAESYGEFVGRVLRIPVDIVNGALKALHDEMVGSLAKYIRSENEVGQWSVPEIIDGVISALKDGYDPVGEAATELMRSFFRGLVKPWDDIFKWVTEKVTWVTTKFSEISTTVDKIKTTLGIGVDGGTRNGNAVQGVDAGVNALENLAWATVGTNVIGATALKALGVDSPFKNIVDQFKGVTKKSDGGYVGAGSLFIAGENGAELIGGGTGGANVTNGNQLAESVAIGNDGVINALLSVGQSIVDAVGDINMNPQIDGMALARGLSPYQKKLASYNGMSLVQSR